MDSLVGIMFDAPIGRGAFGQLWLASDESGRPLAVKVLDADLVDFYPVNKRFERELTDLVTVRDPHLASVVDYVANDETLAILHLPDCAVTSLLAPSSRT